MEVLSGLKAGDLLVVRGAEALSDGVPVRLAAAAPPAGKGESQAAEVTMARRQGAGT